MKVDLHMHTYYSDGTMSPEALVQAGKAQDVKIMAVTDHNRIGAWEGFYKAATQEGIIPIRGVEINAAFGDKVLHILGYAFEPTEELVALLDFADQEMERMSQDVIEKLQLEEPRVSSEDYETYTYDRSKGGWKGIQYLKERGVTEKLFDGFRYYREYGCDFNQYHFPKLEEVCRVLHESGGYAVLAHPQSYYGRLSQEELLETLDQIRFAGIDGIECYYPTHTEALTMTCVAYCDTHDLLITSGSDEHGEFGKEAKTLEQTIGCMNIMKSRLRIDKILG